MHELTFSRIEQEFIKMRAKHEPRAIRISQRRLQLAETSINNQHQAELYWIRNEFLRKRTQLQQKYLEAALLKHHNRTHIPKLVPCNSTTYQVADSETFTIETRILNTKAIPPVDDSKRNPNSESSVSELIRVNPSKSFKPESHNRRIRFPHKRNRIVNEARDLRRFGFPSATCDGLNEIEIQSDYLKIMLGHVI